MANRDRLNKLLSPLPSYESIELVSFAWLAAIALVGRRMRLSEEKRGSGPGWWLFGVGRLHPRATMMYR